MMAIKIPLISMSDNNRFGLFVSVIHNEKLLILSGIVNSCIFNNRRSAPHPVTFYLLGVTFFSPL